MYSNYLNCLFQQFYMLHYMMHNMGPGHMNQMPYNTAPQFNPLTPGSYNQAPYGAMPYGAMPYGAMPNYGQSGMAYPLGKAGDKDIVAETHAIEEIARIIKKGNKKEDLRADTPAIEEIARIIKKDDHKAKTTVMEDKAQIAAKPVGKVWPVRKDAVEIKIKDKLYSPTNLTIAKGTTIVWTNQAESGHSATAEDGSFDSENLNAGQTFSKVLTKPGTYKYYSSKNPMLRGTIQVL